MTSGTTINVGNAAVHYSRTGSGPGLVLVHGSGSACAEMTWGQIAPRFADRRTVITPNLSGTDLTVDDEAPLTVEGLAGQVIAVIEHNGTGPVDLVGFSLGSPVATAVAALRPDLVRRLVLVAGWVATDGDEYLRNLFTVLHHLGAAGTEAFSRLITLTGFSRGFLNAIGRDEVEKLVPLLPPTPGTPRHIDLDLRVDVGPLLPRIEAETLVVGCSQDATVPVEHSLQLHAAIPGSTYAELDAGHVVLFEKTDEFVELVRGFIL
ncbi:alpha/beta hydrolase [Planotetraspora thailandica]|uniref:Alpha/beta hydrolase n=1 Tax=Planotetraspora thailandica TaxID=487172 RepID=A0A8J3UUU0_9ACTN|nr:alpha/beta hydrolase [Planotetraspora thailandica]GII52408.1 alpha/beta hydrolase [Planotetraspora thailandica]